MVVTLLDRYIARHFLINVAALLAILFSFVVLVDTMLNIDRFFGRAVELAGEDADLSMVRKIVVAATLVIDLWWPKLLQLYNYLLGVIMVGAMGFTCAQMVRHRELVAVLASGQSLYRVARPFFIVAIALSAVQLANQELVIPRIAPLLQRGHGEAGERSLERRRVLLVPDASNRLFSAARFNPDAGTLETLLVWELDERDLLHRRVRADRASWNGQAWVLEDGWAQQARSGAPRVPIDRIETELDPTAVTIHQFAGYSQSLSFTQVGRMLEVMDRFASDEQTLADRRARLQRIRWGRFSVIGANLLGLVLAMPLMLTRVPVNMAVQAIKCAPVALGAIMAGIVAQAVPLPGVPAGLGVLAPVIVLSPMILWAASRMRT